MLLITSENAAQPQACTS